GPVPELRHPDTGEMEIAPVSETDKDGRTTVSLRFDPAGSVFVVFRRPASTADHLVAVTHAGGPAAPAHPAPRVEVQRAFYEPTSGRGGADVTARVKALVADGQYSIPATNDFFGDPTPNRVKRLRVEYLLDGQPQRKIAAENETLELIAGGDEVAPPSLELAWGRSGELQLLPWAAGDYTLRTARGRTRQVTARAAGALELQGPWELRFPPNCGAP